MNTKKIEKIQERGLRIVFNDHNATYDDLLSMANRNLLYVNRIKQIALFVFKCLNNIGPEFLHDMYDIKNIPYALRDQHKINQPKVKTTTKGLRSLKYTGAQLWNRLPVYLKDGIHLSTFKYLLKLWDDPNCNRICHMYYWVAL